MQRRRRAAEAPAVTALHTYQDVSLVRKRVVSLLRDEKQLVEEEEGPLVLGPLEAEGSFEHQFPVAGQVGPLPVGEQTLYLLENTHTAVSRDGTGGGRRGRENKAAPFLGPHERCLSPCDGPHGSTWGPTVSAIHDINLHFWVVSWRVNRNESVVSSEDANYLFPFLDHPPPRPGCVKRGHWYVTFTVGILPLTFSPPSLWTKSLRAIDLDNCFQKWKSTPRIHNSKLKPMENHIRHIISEIS